MTSPRYARGTRLVVQELGKLSDPILQQVVLQDRHGILRLSEEVCHGSVVRPASVTRVYGRGGKQMIVIWDRDDDDGCLVGVNN